MVRLKPPIHIAEEKLTRYLLTPLPTNDKSTYLKLAGYTLDNWPVLARDLLLLAETEPATLEDVTEYGDSFGIVSILTGPNERQLRVKTIWMREISTGLTKFITLYPPR